MVSLEHSALETVTTLLRPWTLRTDNLLKHKMHNKLEQMVIISKCIPKQSDNILVTRITVQIMHQKKYNALHNIVTSKHGT